MGQRISVGIVVESCLLFYSQSLASRVIPSKRNIITVYVSLGICAAKSIRGKIRLYILSPSDYKLLFS